MKRIYLVRHGETDFNKEDKIQTYTNNPLNEKGMEDAEKLSNHFSENIADKIDVIYSSDLLRAVQTITPLSKKLGLEINKTSSLQEQNLGDYDGKNYLKFSDTDHEEFFKITKDINYMPRDGIESLKDFDERVISIFNKIIEENSGKTILICTHGLVVKSLVCNILGLDHKNKYNFTISNCAITSIAKRSDSNTLFIERLNYPISN